jgi:hypothetical protein
MRKAVLAAIAVRHARTAPGCYLKGSRVVILQRDDESAVRRRAEALKRR